MGVLMARKPVVLRTQNDYLFAPEEEAAISEAASIRCLDESLTQQHFKDECDINVLAKRFGVDGLAERVPPVDPGYYGAAGQLPELRDVLDIARNARERFMELDPKIRYRFHNDPAELWRFVNDPENREEAVKLGILSRGPVPVAPEPVSVRIVNPEGSPSPPAGK